MIRYLFILFPLFCQSQVVITKINSDVNATASCPDGGVASITHHSFVFTADVYVAVCFIDSCNNYGSISGTTSTWNDVIKVQSGATGNRWRIAVYRTTAVSETVELTLTVTNARAVYFNLYKITGVPKTSNGADAIIQAVADSALSDTDPTISTMAALRLNSGVIALFHNDTNTFNATPETNWSESTDFGCTTGGGTLNNGYYILLRDNAAFDNTPSVTRSATDWIGAAIEFKGNRSIYNAH